MTRHATGGGHSGGPAVADEIELTIPARAELLSLARMTVAAVAARADFDLEGIEDLRLAIDELCSRLVRPAGGDEAGDPGVLRLRFRWADGELEVTCRLHGAPPTPVDDQERYLSDRILEALVDAHGAEEAGVADGAGARCWLRKRRRAPEPA